MRPAIVGIRHRQQNHAMRAPAGGSARCGKHAPFAAGHRLASAHHVRTRARPTRGDQRRRGRGGGRRRRHPRAAPARAPAGGAAAVRAGLAAGRGGAAAGDRRAAAGAGACGELCRGGVRRDPDGRGQRRVLLRAARPRPPLPHHRGRARRPAPRDRVRAQGAPAGVGPGPRGPGDRLDLRPAGGPQRLVQPGQAGSAAHRLPGGLLRADDRRHQRRDGQRPAAPDLDGWTTRRSPPPAPADPAGPRRPEPSAGPRWPWPSGPTWSR